MAKRSRIDQEFYDLLLEAFRRAPGVLARAANAASCDTRTAKRAWVEGWPDRGFRPINEVVEEEMSAARARLKDVRSSEIAEANREKERVNERNSVAARDDAITSRTEEAQTVRAARHNSMALLLTTQRMLRAGSKLAESIESEIANSKMNPARAMAFFQAMASTARQANETAKLAIAMERSLLGEPEKVIGHRIEMTVTQAATEIEAGNRALVRAKARGIVVETTETVETGT